MKKFLAMLLIALMCATLVSGLAEQEFAGVTLNLLDGSLWRK